MDRIQTLVDLALEEDIGTGDITTDAIYGGNEIEKTGVLLAKEDLVVAGLEIARRVFLTVDPSLTWQPCCAEGPVIAKGTTIATVAGHLQGIVRAERTALNFLRHLSGIATFTRKFVGKVKKYPVKILDTRKTLPGMRALEKHAVRIGGGKNHRLGLFDRFLIKENHLSQLSIAEAVERVRKNNPNKVPIEIEIESLGQIEEAIEAGADILLLDNFSPNDLKKGVQIVKGRAKTEASGGIILENVVDYAKTGVNFISIGALTHSAPAVDLSLEIIQRRFS